MVKAKARRTRDWKQKEVKRDVFVPDSDPFMKPPIGQEKVTIPFYKDGFSAEELENEKKDLIKEWEERGYVHLKRVKDINEIFHKLSLKQQRDLRTGRLFCFVWKYSGWTDYLVSVDEKEAFINSLSKRDEALIMSTIAQHDVISMTYLVDEYGFPQLTDKSGRLHDRDGNGEFLYASAGKGKASFPVWRKATIDDIPLEMIKRVCDIEGIKPQTKKAKA
jgi:hypothetical protein